MNVQVSDNFKKMTGKAIFSIALFIFTYLVLLTLSIGLTIACVYMGIMLIVAWPGLIGIALGIGLASLGFFIMIFLFKFLFKRHKTDRSHLVEITREQEPELFKFIEEIVNEVQTDFPKKIYLSADVNACVFYDSGFWSMFFPIRKNLQIGIGLVNTISRQEFKAILAHEFGHFSQRSMKVGSYVYNVNQVIFNMLYDNSSFENMIQRWANVSGYFTIFVILAVRIIEGIQWVLRKMYEIINLSYMALSREMEFHADEVATNVAGYVPLKESLLRMELADHSYNSVIGFYNGKISQNVISRNIFREQQFVMNFLAKESEITFKNNLPLVSAADLNKYNKSKLNIKDQWASHPSVAERIAAVEKLNIVKDVQNDPPAIILFSKPSHIEESLTEKLFSTVTFQDKITEMEVGHFEKEYIETHYKNSFDKAYNGYYDNKNPNEFDVNTVAETNSGETFQQLYNDEKVNMIYEHIGMVNDREILLKIANKEFQVKSYDYDGRKYRVKDAASLAATLEKEISFLNDRITDNDRNIFNYFSGIAEKTGRHNALRQLYTGLSEESKTCDKNNELFNQLIEATRFMQEVTQFEDIIIKLGSLKLLEESLKKEIRRLLANEALASDTVADVKNNFEKYIASEWTYFEGESYNEENLQMLFGAIHEFNFMSARSYFLYKKELLNFQITLYKAP